MSKPLDLQDGTGIIVEVPGLGILVAHVTSQPTLPDSAYATGCILINTSDGTVKRKENATTWSAM